MTKHSCYYEKSNCVICQNDDNFDELERIFAPVIVIAIVLFPFIISIL